MELASTHFGLTLDPPVVPPGGTLLLRYRAVNHGAVPAPPATVEFLIDPAAVDERPAVIDLGVLAPGAVRNVSATVKLSSLVQNGSSVHVQAALSVGDDDPLGSNVAVAHVRGRAILAAAPSRVVLRPAGSGAWTLDAVIANTGDAPADETRLVIELPAGLCAAAGARRIERAVPPLEPGASATLTFALTVDGIPALPLQILDAALIEPDGRRIALPPSEPVVPVLEPPALTLTLERTGRRIDARITIDNPNAAALTDLMLDASWPRTLRLAGGSMLVDGRAPLRPGARAASATLKMTADGATIAVARIAPRAAATITFSGFIVAAAAGDVMLALRSADCESATRASIPMGQTRGPALVLAAGVPAVVAGSEATVNAFLSGGDEACNLSLSLDDAALRAFVDGSPLAPGTALALAAGTRRDVQIVVPVAAGAADGSRIEHRVRVTSDRGDVAELVIAVDVRSRAWLEIAEWLVPADGAMQLGIANAGSTPASDVRLEAADGTALALDSIAPGETVTRTIDARTAAALAAGAHLMQKGSVAVPIPPLRRPSAASPAVALEVPADVHEGIAFDARWTIGLPAGASALAVRCVEHAGLTVVPGSTSIDGCAIVDGRTARIAEGLMLHGVPAGSQISFAARCIARAPGAVAVAIATAIDGGEETIASEHVRAAARAAFPQKPDALRFYLDAPAIAVSLAQHAPALDEPVVEPAPKLDDVRRALLVRALRRTGDDPIADALGVIAALMPAGEPREAFSENAERLSVKLRIPGYRADAGDYESAAARSALDRARGEAGIGPLAAARGSAAALAVWCATIDPAAAPGLPITTFLRAFVQYAGDGQPADRLALEGARDELRAALAVTA